jgi:hypothetical protein
MRGREEASEFDTLDEVEKAATKAALERCRVLADRISSELGKYKPEDFVNVSVLADFYASLEEAAGSVLAREKQRQGPFE